MRVEFRKLVVFAVLLPAIFQTFPDDVLAELLNGDFEQSIEGMNFNTPADWNCVNYTAVVSSFFPNPTRGSYENWKINIEPNNPIKPFSGNSLLALSTGNLIEIEPMNADVWQDIYLDIGQSVIGVYFFGTCDYIPYSDYAYMELQSLDTPENPAIQVFYEAVDDPNIGSYGSTPGWMAFESPPIEDGQQGMYRIFIRVSDGLDHIYETYLLLDGMRVCTPPENGDVNVDCKVDLWDLALVSENWMLEAENPDIRFPYYADLDGDGIINSNEVDLINVNWLDGDFD